MPLSKVFCSKPWIYPFGFGIGIFSLKFVYPFAVWNGHVEPLLPYTSDFGANEPEAAFFSLLSNLNAIFFGLTAFFRFKQIQFNIETKVPKSNQPKPANIITKLLDISSVNLIAAAVAYVSTILQIVAGNFRSGEWFYVHYAFIITASIALTFYSCFMAYIAHSLAKHKVETPPKSLALLSIVALATGMILAVFMMISFYLSEGQFAQAEFRLKWNSQQNGYYWHIASTSLDWLQMILYSLIGFSLTRRMKSFQAWDKIFMGKY